MASSGSRAGRREGSALIDEMTSKWELYNTMGAEYESMDAERMRIYEQANAETVPVERARLFESVHRLEERMEENNRGRMELLNFLEENAEDAIRAARAIRGSGRAETLDRMENIQMAIFFIHEDMEQMQRDAEHAAGELPLQAQPQRTAEAAEARPAVTEALPVSGVTAQYSTDYDTVMGWWRRFTRLEEENDELNRKCASYREREGEAETEGNTRRANYYINKIEGLERQIDANMAEQVQLMANLVFSLSDALFASMGNRRHSDALMRIYDTWQEHQAKMLEQIDIRGSGWSDTAVIQANAKFFCAQTMDQVYAQMRGAERAYVAFSTGQQPLQGVVPSPPPPQTAVVPTPAAPAEAAAPTVAQVELAPVYSTDYSTVTGWGRRISQIESENRELMRRAVEYRNGPLMEAERAGDSGRIEHYDNLILGLERQFDANVEEQTQLMANISRSLADAIEAARTGGNRSRVQSLERMMGGWPEVQARLLDIIDVRGSVVLPRPGGSYPEPMRARIMYLCGNPMDVILAEMLGAAPAAPAVAEAVPAAPAVAEAVPAAPTVVGEPAVAPSAETFSGDRARWALNLYADIQARLGRLDEVPEAGREQYIALLARDYLTLRAESRQIREAVARDFSQRGIGETTLNEMNRLRDAGPRLGERIEAATGMASRELRALADSRFPVGAIAAVPEAPVAAAPAEAVAGAVYNAAWAAGLQTEIRAIVRELANLPAGLPGAAQARHDALIARGRELYIEFFSHVGEAAPSPELDRVRAWMERSTREGGMPSGMGTFGLALNAEGEIVGAAPVQIGAPPAPAEAQAVAPPAAQAVAVPGAGPVLVPEGKEYFEYVSPTNGRRYRIAIRGEDLSGMSLEEVYSLVQEYAESRHRFRDVKVEWISDRGRNQHTYVNMEYIRDEFFQQLLGYSPGAPLATALPTAQVTGAPSVEVDAVAAQYLLNQADAERFMRFQRGEYVGNLRLSVATEEQANRVFEIVHAEAERRGEHAEVGVDAQADGTFSIFYRRRSEYEFARTSAIQAQNPVGIINMEAHQPISVDRTGYGVDDFGTVIPDYNVLHPDSQVTFVGYGTSDEVAADPESQMVAGVGDTMRRLVGMRFGAYNGLDVASTYIYSMPAESSTYELMEMNGLPVLSQRENAAWAAAAWTAMAGRIIVTLQGEEMAEGQSVNVLRNNILRALTRDLRGNPSYDKYAAFAYDRLNAFYANPQLLGWVLDGAPADAQLSERELEAFGELRGRAPLPAEVRAGLDVAAELWGKVMYEERSRRLGGEPATQEERDRLMGACINAAMMQLVARSYAEGGSLTFTFFTHGGREYLVGTNYIGTADFENWAPPGGFVFDDGTRSRAGSHHMLFVPTDTPGRVQIVGVIDNGRLRMLEPSTPVFYELDPRDSIGLAALTSEWSYRLPMIDVGRYSPFSKPYEDVAGPPYVGLATAYEDVAPPAVVGPVTPEPALFRGQFGVEQRGDYTLSYTRGEIVDDAWAVIQNPRMGRDDASMVSVTPEELFSDPGTWIEYNNFRRVGDNRFYATVSPEVIARYGDRFEDPEDVQHVAEFRNGKIYIYVNAEGKIVDAYEARERDDVTRLPPAGQDWTYDFTMTRDERDRPVITNAEINIPEEYRLLIMSRLYGQDILPRIVDSDLAAYDRSANRLDIRIPAAESVHARLIPGEEIATFAMLYAPPRIMAETQEEGIVSRLFRAELQELEALHQEFISIASTVKTFTDAEAERRAEIRMAEIIIRRREIYDGMLQGIEGYIPQYAGKDLEALERFRQDINENLQTYFAGYDIPALREYIEYAQGESFYSHAYMVSQWEQLAGIRASFEELRSQYDQATEDAELTALEDRGWQAVYERRQLYEAMLRHLEASIPIYTGTNADLLADYRRELDTNMAEIYPQEKVNYAELAERFGG